MWPHLIHPRFLGNNRKLKARAALWRTVVSLACGQKNWFVLKTWQPTCTDIMMTSLPWILSDGMAYLDGIKLLTLACLADFSLDLWIGYLLVLHVCLYFLVCLVVSFICHTLVCFCLYLFLLWYLYLFQYFISYFLQFCCCILHLPHFCLSYYFSLLLS